MKKKPKLKKPRASAANKIVEEFAQEMDALRTVVVALRGLDFNARVRIIRYVGERFSIDISKLDRPPPAKLRGEP